MSDPVLNALQLIQINQLNQINSHAAYQTSVYQSQTRMADVLFQTEQRTRQLEIVARQDAFAAGLMSAMWLDSLEGVRAELLYGLGEKRSWLTLSAKLQAMKAEVWRDQEQRVEAECFVRAAQDAVRFQQLLGNTPEATMAEIHSSMEAQERDLKGLRQWQIMLFFLFLLSLALAMVSSFYSVLVLVAIVPQIVLPFLIASSRQLLIVRMDAVARVRPAFDQWQAFHIDPRRESLFERLCKEHLALVSPLPSVDMNIPLSESEAPSSVMVERQVIVGRCKYCKALTPVDAPVCQICGAYGFI